MITIFCEEATSRFTYTFDLVFNLILAAEYELTSDRESYHATTNAKFSYGTHPVDDGLFLRSSGLLAENDIRPQSVEVGELNSYPALFKVQEPSAIQYDLFSAIFYMVSRYEEYLPGERDEHGRYCAHQSVASLGGFLELPIADIWAQMIGQLLKEKYPGLVLGERSFRYTNTIDIDNAFAYAGKGGVRTVGGIIKSAIRLDKADLTSRIETLSGKGKDPYDTYAYMKELATKYNKEVKSFVLLGDYGPYDKNLPHSSAEQIQAVKHMAEFSEVGMHPSYDSAGRVDQVQKEMGRLSEILDRPVKTSRQHYLKLKIPDTYRILINCGIEEDHSMGYSEVLGFRAGTCTPFRFYDLELETSTDLIVYPFALMDRTLNDYLSLSPDEAIKRVEQVAKEVKAVGGTLISIWHNESLSDELEWKGWLPVYKHLQRYGSVE